MSNRKSPAPPAARQQAAGKRPLLLDLEALSRFDNLLIFAQTVVDGYFGGRHKSPFFGSAAEFADYREYQPGDDLSKIDWQVYGKSRRLYIRQYQEETDMVVYLLVDTSASMSYAGPHGQDKYLLCARIAAALAYLMIRQGDKLSLTLYDEKVYRHFPAGGTRGHLYSVVQALEEVTPRKRTGTEQALAECTSLFRRRGRIVILSDFLGETAPLFDALARFSHRRFEVQLLQLLDHDERHLPDVDIARFRDLETGEMIEVEPGEIRRTYRDLMAAHLDELGRQSQNRRIRYSLVESHQPYLSAIETYLGFRHASQRGGG
jgi:uncharacterized protein (DUF58 family)